MDSDPKMVEVGRYQTELEAILVAAALEEAGINCVTTGGFVAGFRAEAPGWVSVSTMEADAERARKIIQQHSTTEDGA